jgi:hypothetical protein
VADIKDDAALFGGQRRRQQPPILDDVGEIARQVRRTRIGVGQDVAGPQQIEDLGHQGAGLDPADMHHHAAPGSGLLAGGDRPLQRLDAVFGDDVFRHSASITIQITAGRFSPSRGRHHDYRRTQQTSGLLGAVPL